MNGTCTLGLRGSSRTGANEASQKPALGIPLKLERRQVEGKKERLKQRGKMMCRRKPEFPGRETKTPVSVKINQELHGIRDEAVSRNPPSKSCP